MKLGTTVIVGAAGLISLTFFGAVALEGCSSSNNPSNPADGGVDGSAGQGLPPGPPTSGTTPASTAEHNFALHHLHLGDETGTSWQDYGYNLDGKITTSTSTDVCTLTTNANKKNQIDGPGGIDNSFGQTIIPLLGSVVPNPSNTINTSIGAGKFTVMMDVVGLSGAGQTSTGLSGQLFGGVPFSQGPNAATAMPTWTTADNWPLDKSYITSTINSDNTLAKPVKSNVAFTGAYITGGEFVNGSPTEVKLSLTISGVPLPIDILHAYLTFKYDGSGKLTSGVIGGVINTQALLNNLQGVAGNISPTFCNGAAFQQIETSIAAASDIMSDATNAPGAACDGISIGVGFDADEIALPQVVGLPSTGTNPCADAGTATDSGTDSGSAVDSGTADTGASGDDGGGADATGE